MIYAAVHIVTGHHSDSVLCSYLSVSVCVHDVGTLSACIDLLKNNAAYSRHGSGL